MFRALRLHRRPLLAAAGTAVAVHTSQDKPPIYPRPDPVLILQEQPSELERQIGVVRQAVTEKYLETYGRVQDVVSRWIGVEQAVEHRIKSLVDPTEPLTPGLLYVGVSTLTGSILARNRSALLRVSLPPTLFVLSFSYFLPRTSQNVSSYLSSLEDQYFPTLAQKHEVAKAHTRMTIDRIKEAGEGSKEKLSESLVAAIEKLQEVTGLKLKETLGLGKELTKAYGEGVMKATEQKWEQVKHSVESAKQEVKQEVHKEIEEIKAGGEKKTEEVKRLV